MHFTTLPPQVCLIEREEIRVNCASAFSIQPEFRKSLKYKGLFSMA